MRVLIWQDYGNPQVHCAETVEQLVRLSDQMKTTVADWGVDEEIKEFDEELHGILHSNEGPKKKKPKIEVAMLNFFDEVGGKEHESFEQFTFKDVLYS